MSETSFFKDLEPFSDFSKALDKFQYVPAPKIWRIATVNVKNSADEIREGRYKEVNIVAASAIMAVLNATKDEDEIPYTFNGDGANFVISPGMVEAVAEALKGTREMAWDKFGMDLRAAIIPVSVIRDKGREMNIAKYCISDDMSIAMFDGGGLACAEDISRDPKLGQKYDIENHLEKKKNIEADFNGLECRWEPIKSKTLTVMVQVRDEGQVENAYCDILDKIEEIYGDEEEYSPAKEERMRLSFRAKYLKQEHSVQTYEKCPSYSVFYAIKMGFEAVLGTILFTCDLNAAGVEGKKYVKDAVNNTDFKKFDDRLRMAIESTEEQAERLKTFLDEEYKAGRIFYGTVAASEAMMTCLIFDRQGKHLHFIDGATGGFALAEKRMKDQMRARK